MTKDDTVKLLDTQRRFFENGHTLSIDGRIAALKRLYRVLRANETRILEALKKDLGKSGMEGFMCELGLVLSEITHMIKHVRRYAATKHVPTPVTNFHSESLIHSEPYGNVLIMSPWNYPFLLTMEPLIDAIAAGNTVIVKPSAYSPATSKVIESVIRAALPEGLAAVVTGGREENRLLLTMKFDYIFFTGSQAVGKEVLRQAAEHLTPVTLELGGKSPCIVDETADLKLTARRIVWGKFLNCGQTCVAPDYILCHISVKERLVELLRQEIIRQFGKEPLLSDDYGKIINEKHFNRLIGLINKDKLVIGGKYDKDACKIEPTLMDNVTRSDAVMQEEIFGPVLPVLTYSDIDDVVKDIERREHPLALYVFSNDKANIRRLTRRIRFGGGCINDVVVHLATSNIPFGGFGESGMGQYHGRFGFETFTHKKSVLDKKQWIDLPMRYQPFVKLYESALRIFLR